MTHSFGDNVNINVPFGIFETKWDAFSFWYKQIHEIDLNAPEYTSLLPVIDVDAAMELYNFRTSRLVSNEWGNMLKYDPYGWLYCECKPIKRVACPFCQSPTLEVHYTCLTPDKQQTDVKIPVCCLYIRPKWQQASDAAQEFCDNHAYGIKTYTEGSTYRVSHYEGECCKLNGFMSVVEQYMDPAFTIMPEGSFDQALEKFYCASCRKDWYSPSQLAIDLINKKKENEQNSNN